MMSADDATITNLWILGVLAIWRILLMSRVLAVLYVPRVNDVLLTGMLFVVLLVVDTAALCNLGGDRPIMMVGNNSGVLPGEYVVLRVLSLVTIAGILTWPIWLVGVLAVIFWEGTHWSWVPEFVTCPQPLSSGVKGLAAASLLIWVLLLPLTQPEQLRRYATERDQQQREVTATATDDAIRPGQSDLKRQ